MSSQFDGYSPGLFGRRPRNRTLKSSAIGLHLPLKDSFYTLSLLTLNALVDILNAQLGLYNVDRVLEKSNASMIF